MSAVRQHEGLGILRLAMVVGSFSPLFLLWAVRGTCQQTNVLCQVSREVCLVPNLYFVAVCSLFIVLPNLFLLWRRRTARKHQDTGNIVVGKAEDHRDHLLVYLFSMLIPFYTTNLTSEREFIATLLAVCFIIFLFWYNNLHYMNILFAICGYRIFTVHPPVDGNSISGRESVVLITRRSALFQGDRIIPYRLSNSVYWEVE